MAPKVPEVGVTVKGRLARTVVVITVLSAMAAAAFFGGRGLADFMNDNEVAAIAGGPADTPQSSESTDSTAADGATDETDGDPTTAESTEDGAAPLEATVDGGPLDGAETLRFIPFADPTVVIDAETSAELNNSVGVDTSVFDGPEAAALVADLVVRGPVGSTVSVHPGDRPADALRFTIPGNGRLLVPHLIAPTDDAGRIVVAAEDQVTVTMAGIGRYVPADQSRAGRFVNTRSIQIGSLVTATDGRTLTMDLSDVLGSEAEQVGQAVVRLNANVSQDGGSVAVADGPPILWPGPPNPDLGLAGTELLTVNPDEDGVITMTYLGGSVMTVDLVGYYTNEAAPESASGLLVLSPTPEFQTIAVEAGTDAADTSNNTAESTSNSPSNGTSSGLEQDVIIGFAPPEQADGQPSEQVDAGLGGGGNTVAIIEAANGDNGGSLRFWTEPHPSPKAAAFALAPGQQRSTTEWFDPGNGVANVRAPAGSTLRIWTIGTYTSGR